MVKMVQGRLAGSARRALTTISIKMKRDNQLAQYVTKWFYICQARHQAVAIKASLYDQNAQ